jgi:hypothetical protein
MNDCPICSLRSERSIQEGAWQALLAGGPTAVSQLLARNGVEVSNREVERHFSKHRPLQAPTADKLSSGQALEVVRRLSPKLRAVLALLLQSPGMSARQIADLCYLGQNPDSALPAARRDLRKLQHRGLVLQVFLEQVAGPGPRPGGEVPGLYFPSTNSRSYYRQLYGHGPSKGREWWDCPEDWPDWQAPYQAWQRAEARGLITSQLPLLGPSYRGGPGMRLDWAGIYDRAWSSFRFDDQLLGRVRFRSDGLLGISLPGGTVPLFLIDDRGSREAEDLVRRAGNLSAAHRSGVLGERFDLPRDSRALLLILTQSPERVLELREWGQRITVAGDSPTLVCDRVTAGLGFGRSCWQPLYSSGDPISLEFGLKGMLRWETLPAGETIRPRLSRNSHSD